MKRSFSKLEDFGAHLRGILGVEDPGEVRFSTAHGFKGQEADAVVLTDVTRRNYPLIHPTWTLFQVFGDTVETLTEAERRLFYVGVSRPHVHLDVITTVRDPSEFWRDVRQLNPVRPSEWDELSDVRLAGGAGMIEIRADLSTVENFSLSVELLKRSGFKFHSAKPKYWWRRVPVRAWDTRSVKNERWAQQPGVRIEIWCDGQMRERHTVPGRRSRWAPS